jgi:hypothetical protein
MVRSPVEICRGTSPEPGGEIATLGEHFAIADRRHHGTRDDWPDAPHRHQTLARRVFLDQVRDVGIAGGEDRTSLGSRVSSRAVEAKGRHMNKTAILEWLPLQRIGVTLVIGFIPALIARWKRRAMMPWYLYGA